MSLRDQKISKDDRSRRVFAEQFFNSNEDRPWRNVNILEGTLASGISVTLGALKFGQSDADAADARGLEKWGVLRSGGRNTGRRSTKNSNDMVMLAVPTSSGGRPRDHGVESTLAVTMTTMITSDSNITISSNNSARCGKTGTERRRTKGEHGCVISGEERRPEGIMTRAELWRIR